MNAFWLHRDQIYAQGLNIGFRTFSAGHLLWLLAIALFCYLSGRFYRSRDARGKDILRKACGLCVVLLEYAKVIVMGLFQVSMLEFVPLHLCSAAGVAVLVYAMWPRKWLGQLFAYAFFPATILAVVFPSTTMYPWWNFYCLHTFVFHALLMAFFVWLFMDGEVVPNYRGLLLSLLFMALFAVPIYYLDGVFQVNYMFLGMRSDVGVLAAMWDSLVPTYGRAVYALTLSLIMAANCHVFYGVYYLLGKLRRVEGKKESGACAIRKE